MNILRDNSLLEYENVKISNLIHVYEHVYKNYDWLIGYPGAIFDLKLYYPDFEVFVCWDMYMRVRALEYMKELGKN